MRLNPRLGSDAKVTSCTQTGVHLKPNFSRKPSANEQFFGILDRDWK
jgi:hypothetical protein